MIHISLHQSSPSFIKLSGSLGALFGEWGRDRKEGERCIGISEGKVKVKVVRDLGCKERKERDFLIKILLPLPYLFH